MDTVGVFGGQRVKVKLEITPLGPGDVPQEVPLWATTTHSFIMNAGDSYTIKVGGESRDEVEAPAVISADTKADQLGCHCGPLFHSSTMVGLVQPPWLPSCHCDPLLHSSTVPPWLPSRSAIRGPLL